MSVSRRRLELVDRRWSRFVFGLAVRNTFLLWLGVSTLGMLVGSMLGVRPLSAAAVGYAFPLLFVCTSALVASYCAVKAMVALARREMLVAVWMAGWTGILVLVCISGVRWLRYGLNSDIAR